MNHVSVSSTDGNGPTHEQRKTLTRVGIEPTTFGLDHRCSADFVKMRVLKRVAEVVVFEERGEKNARLGNPSCCSIQFYFK